VRGGKRRREWVKGGGAGIEDSSSIPWSAPLILDSRDGTYESVVGAESPTPSQKEAEWREAER
jgi:hypothetical protein